MRPHRRQPIRLPRPWDSPGKNTGVGCHFLLQCMKVKSESEVAQLCPTLSNPMDCSPPGSSIHGIFQARVLEWGAIAFSGTAHYPLANYPLHWPFLQETTPQASSRGRRATKACLDAARSFSLASLGKEVKVKSACYKASCVLVAQSCPALCDPMDYSLPVSSVHGVLLAIILEWVAIPSSRGSSQPRDCTWVLGPLYCRQIL